MNTMRRDIDEAELVAYALGELSEEDKAKIEKHLESDPLARVFVLETKQAATALETALKADLSKNPIALEPARIEAIQHGTKVQAPAIPIGAKPRRWIYVLAPIAAAAGFAVFATTTMMRAAQKAPDRYPSIAVTASPAPSTVVIDPSGSNAVRETAVKESREAAGGDKFNGQLAAIPPTMGDTPTPEPWYPAPKPKGPPHRSSTQPLSIDSTKTETPYVRASAGEDPPAKVSLPADDARAIVMRDGHALYERDEKRPLSPPAEHARRAKKTSNGLADNRYHRMILPANKPPPEAPVLDNPFYDAADHPRSTFSIDVDTASYANIRRYLRAGRMPPKDAVRIEEMINYFDYDLPTPAGKEPFSVVADVSDAPWQSDHLLARVALKGKTLSAEEAPPTNLVFLIDVSCSMRPPERLPLIKQGLDMLVDHLRPEDQVAIVVYAGAAGLVLPSTKGDHKDEIRAALERLNAGGSTNGGAGIHLAYAIAARHFIPKGSNRVILATDGDFNVGVSSEHELVELIQEKAKTGVYLTVLGVGTDNFKDSRLEKLADRGNGNYAYLDTTREAKKVLVDGMGGTLHTIAKDVKVQIEFNPARVQSYRLIGYENRILDHRDFKDDKKDAGDIGAGHTVTVLYELVPNRGHMIVEAASEGGEVDPLKYQSHTLKKAAENGELFTVKLRYKAPDGDVSKQIERPVHEKSGHYQDGSADFKFAAAVAELGMLLRDSPHRGNATYAKVLELARLGVGDDLSGHRAEFLELVRTAAALSDVR
jgi:Ca-activated chloride channel family protein